MVECPGSSDTQSKLWSFSDKQGLGRLIRSTADRGILAVLDARMVTSRYGAQFFRSLPTMPVGHELTDLERFFEHEPVVVAHRDSS